MEIDSVLAVALPAGLFFRSLWLARKAVRPASAAARSLLWAALYMAAALFAASWLSAAIVDAVGGGAAFEKRAALSRQSAVYLFFAVLTVLEARQPLAFLRQRATTGITRLFSRKERRLPAEHGANQKKKR